MTKLIKILHIDKGWEVIYILIRAGALVKTSITMETAVILLEKQKLDLILSEPQNIAILHPQATIGEESMKQLPLWEKSCKNHWDLVSRSTEGG